MRVTNAPRSQKEIDVAQRVRVNSVIVAYTVRGMFTTPRDQHTKRGRSVTGVSPFSLVHAFLSRVNGHATQTATAFERAPFLFAHSAPDTGILAGLQCPLQAFFSYGAAPADSLGLLDLHQGGTAVSNGKNSSGSSSRQMAWWRQSISATLLDRIDTTVGGPHHQQPCEYFHELAQCQGASQKNLGPVRKLTRIIPGLVQ